MKNCPKCNAELADDALFCNNCGEKLEAVEKKAEEVKEEVKEAAEEKVEEVKEAVKEEVKEAAEEATSTVNSTLEDAQAKSKNAQVGLIAIAAGIIVALIIVICLLGSLLGGGYKKPIKTIVNNLNKKSTNITAYLNCVAPKEVVDTYTMAYGIVKSTNKDAIDDFEDMIKEGMEDAIEELEDEYGDNVKISYEIKKAKKMSKSDLKDVESNWSSVADMLEKMEIDDEDFYEELSEMFDDEYDEEFSEKNIEKMAKQGEKLIDALDDVKVTEGYKVKLKYTIKGKDDSDSETIEFNVIKLNGQWIIDGSSYSSELRYIF